MYNYIILIYIFLETTRSSSNKKRKLEHNQNINIQNNQNIQRIERNFEQKKARLEITKERISFYNSSRDISMSCVKLNDNKYPLNCFIPVLPITFFSSSQ